ncbi:MAG TPA: hypothetical protein IAB59_01205 [Candidatus Onthousia faecipullorum]|uniref:Uncharacterized protein n=1 Tax=Candidatus Onthousia faecipullorum TaxID=2840887 RepID=A0A9D1GAA6_9FIRM|nr:hypothetical protein [Candidatus Onthousia faecipullorum]
MDIYEKSRGILLINIVIIWYMLDVFGPSAKFIVEFSTYIILLLCTLYLINDNIFSYDEKYKKIAFIFTGILILLHFFTNIGDIEDIQLYSFVYAFLRSMLSFLAVLEAIFIIEGIIKSRFKKK